MSSPAQNRVWRFPRKLKIVIGLLAGVSLIIWFFGNGWVATRFEKALTGGLHRQGLDLHWKSSSWDPWRGLHLTGLKLTQRDGEKQNIAELDHLNLTLPFAQAFSKETRITRWRVSGSDVTLHDNEGPVMLRNVSLDLEASAGEIVIKRFRSEGPGLAVDVHGTVHFKPSGKPRTGPLELRLGAVRSTLATLDFKQENPFKVTGDFSVDKQPDSLTWKTNLAGEGKDLDWKGVRWEKGAAKAVLSSESSSIGYEMHTSNGSTRGEVSREDWKESPFVFKGELRDKADRVDSYDGHWRKGVFTLAHLAGSADLIALARDVPAMEGSVPENLKFHTFPTVEVKNFVREQLEDAVSWKVASVVVASKEEVGFNFDGRETKARGVSVHAAHDGQDWIIRDAKAGILGGTVTVEGRLRDKKLQRARVTADKIRLSELKQLAAGKSGSSRGVVSGNFNGSIDLAKARGNGSGSMRLDNAPVLEVPLLDEVFDLFNTLIPGVKRSEDGRFEADFKMEGSMVDVRKFEATGGSLTVSAVGKVNLDKRTVSGGARGKLTGLPGMVTSPLSRLLEM
ncbi:MAG: hypothetical protein EOP88_02715, partial [Verrucomicrobiaceae bacterium]